MQSLQILVDFGAKHVIMNTIFLANMDYAPLKNHFRVHNLELRKAVKIFLKSHDVTIEFIETDKVIPEITSNQFRKETGITKGLNDQCIPLYVNQVNSTTAVCDKPETYIFFD